MKAVLFDNDGVLADTEEMFFEATRAAFEAAGTELARSLWARHYLGEGQHSRDIARRLGIAPSSVEEIIARRDRLFWEKVDRGVPILPGVPQTLDRLVGHFRLAIVTGAPRYHADRVHTSTGLLTFFETMITQDDYAAPKPSPDAYHTALERLRLRPEDCVAVEDSPRGAAAALAAGVRCYVVPTALTDRSLCPAGCGFLHSLADLPAALQVS